MAVTRPTSAVSQRSRHGSGVAEETAPPAYDWDQVHRFLGSQSHTFVDVGSCLLHDQLAITTRTQARHQIVLLKVRGFGIA
jgi:hypothetical protein